MRASWIQYVSAISRVDGQLVSSSAIFSAKEITHELYTVDRNRTTPDLKIKQLKDGIYLHKSFNRNSGFAVVASNGLVVVDAKNAYIIDIPTSLEDSEKLVSWLFLGMAKPGMHRYWRAPGAGLYRNEL